MDASLSTAENHFAVAAECQVSGATVDAPVIATLTYSVIKLMMILFVMKGKQRSILLT